MLAKLAADRTLRQAVVRESHYWFFHLFFSHYVQYATARFQRKMFKITEDRSIKLAVVTAFRGSAKSTILTMSYPLWAIMGSPQKKFILIISKTQGQAKAHFENIKRELESNTLLRGDLGPFRVEGGEWGQYSITLEKYGARITAVSSEQSVRGLRHGPHRPQVVIVDDVEDLNSVRTREGREKIYNWFSSEVIPIGDRDTRIIVTGNLLHEDSLLKRLEANITNGSLNGKCFSCPLVDEAGKIAWPGKYPDQEAVEEERKRIGNEGAWQREYLLRIIPDLDRVVQREWIQYYDALPDESGLSYRGTATGIDLAISETTSSDFTAMVSAKMFGEGRDLRIYILPSPVNERLDFPTTRERIKLLSQTLGNGQKTDLFVESVGYQMAMIQQLQEDCYPAYGFQPHGQDKRARLTLTTHLIQNGTILFPKNGVGDLLDQIIEFGVARHDDLADAFAILILKLMEKLGQKFTYPGSDSPDPINLLSREEGEHAADLELIWQQESARAGFPLPRKDPPGRAFTF